MYEHSIIKKSICILFSCLLLCSAFTLPCFASDGNIIDSNLNNWTYITNYHPTIVYNSNSNNNQIQFASNSSGNIAIKVASYNASSWIANHSYKLSFDLYGDFSKVTFSATLSYQFSNGQGTLHDIFVFRENLRANGNTSAKHYSVYFEPTAYESQFSSMDLQFWFSYIAGSSNENINIANITLIDTDDDTGFWSKLWEWMNSLYAKLNQLISSIGTQFSNLWTNLSSAFDDIGQWFADLGEDIGQWFVDLGDDIAEFFDTLRDWLLYFQHPVDLDENGVPVDEYGEPIYENIFDIPDFFETLDDWIDDLDTARSDVESGASAGIQAFSSTIGPITSLLNRVPFLTIFITFALAVIVIKKVIG